MLLILTKVVVERPVICIGPSIEALFDHDLEVARDHLILCDEFACHVFVLLLGFAPSFLALIILLILGNVNEILMCRPPKKNGNEIVSRFRDTISAIRKFLILPTVN